MINRPRPNETEPNIRVLSVREVHGSTPHHVARGRSFTSGHACNNVALAMVGCAIFGRWALWLWPWAALVSYSRIYVGAHYPSDILGSWLVALIYSFLILKAAESLWQKHAPDRWPNLYAAHPVLFPSWAGACAGLTRPGRKNRPTMEPRILSDYPCYAPPRRPFAWVTWTLSPPRAAFSCCQLIDLHRYGDDIVGDALAFGPQAIAEDRYWTPHLCVGPCRRDVRGCRLFLAAYRRQHDPA